MSSGFEASPPSPRQYAEQVLARSEPILHEAVGIAFPETPDADPLTVFPAPTELRAESPDIPELDEERRASLLEKASELGFGRAENVTLSEQGLTSAIVILEGGQPHKMLAEAHLVVDDPEANPRSIIISASPHRVLKNPAEIASAERLFGRAGRTEYDVALDVMRAVPGFAEWEEPAIVTASYDINNGFATSEEPSGQFMTIGQIGFVPVMAMKIDRRDLGDGKYDRQPETDDVLRIVDAVAKARGSGDTTSPIVHVTSGAYRPSRTLGVALAGLSAERLVGIATYGNDLLNRIKDDNAPPPVGQLPSELHKMAKKAVELREALAA